MNEISIRIRKTVRSLSTTKGRRAEGCFVVEGTKSVLDALGSFELRGLYATSAWYDSHSDVRVSETLCYCATRAEMERMTSLSTPSDVMAVFAIPTYPLPRVTRDHLYLALDDVADPGNLGTIVRMADWFGVEDIFASRDTVDIYNPKAVMATMGSIGRVRVHYVDLHELLARSADGGVQVWGTFLDGVNLYDMDSTAPTGGIIVMGNEGHGISADVARTVTRRLYIPPYPANRHGAESLNVAVATAITLAEFRRRAMKNNNGKDKV